MTITKTYLLDKLGDTDSTMTEEEIKIKIRIGHWNHLKITKKVIYIFGNGKDLDLCRSIKEKSFSLHHIDEIIIQIGRQHFWVWICIEPIHNSLLGIYISEDRNMFVT